MGQGVCGSSETTTNKEITTEHRGGCFGGHPQDGSNWSKSDQTAVPTLGA
jgi:hypothetical protein